MPGGRLDLDKPSVQDRRMLLTVVAQLGSLIEPSAEYNAPTAHKSRLQECAEAVLNLWARPLLSYVSRHRIVCWFKDARPDFELELRLLLWQSVKIRGTAKSNTVKLKELAGLLVRLHWSVSDSGPPLIRARLLKDRNFKAFASRFARTFPHLFEVNKC